VFARSCRRPDHHVDLSERPSTSLGDSSFGADRVDRAHFVYFLGQPRTISAKPLPFQVDCTTSRPGWRGAAHISSAWRCHHAPGTSERPLTPGDRVADDDDLVAPSRSFSAWTWIFGPSGRSRRGPVSLWRAPFFEGLDRQAWGARQSFALDLVDGLGVTKTLASSWRPSAGCARRCPSVVTSAPRARSASSAFLTVMATPKQKPWVLARFDDSRGASPRAREIRCMISAVPFRQNVSIRLPVTLRCKASAKTTVIRWRAAAGASPRLRPQDRDAGGGRQEGGAPLLLVRAADVAAALRKDTTQRPFLSRRRLAAGRAVPPAARSTGKALRRGSAGRAPGSQTAPSSPCRNRSRQRGAENRRIRDSRCDWRRRRGHRSPDVLEADDFAGRRSPAPVRR